MGALQPLGGLTLLRDGQKAFPAILEAIDAARTSIDINMFIWRDDKIGNRMAEAVLAAARRGVRVHISVDRYGAVLERAEECRRSFFHKRLRPAEECKARFLTLFYPRKNSLPPQRELQSELYRNILNEENITLDCDRHKADHSKFYVIDGRILFLGGINIEDKENGADRQGRVYGDYMVRLEGEEYVAAFLKKRSGLGDTSELPLSFPMNLKEIGIFEMEEHYLSLIRSASSELTVVMAYLSPLRRFTDALIEAHRRGVRVRVLIPGSSNFQDDSNKRTVRRLLRATRGGIEVYLSPKMLHTKLVMNEEQVSFGSTNITKKAFSQLDELNLCVRRLPSPFVSELDLSLREELSFARRVCAQEIRYRRIKAMLEGLLV